MTKSNETLLKLLPRTQFPEPDKTDDSAIAKTRNANSFNVILALFAAFVLSLVLQPSFPLLQKGETARSEIRAPYSLYFQHPGQGDTLVSSRLNKGEIIVEKGQPVSDKAARALEEVARREGIGSRSGTAAGLTLLLLLLFYLFYRDIKRYQPTLAVDTKKLALLIILLFTTVILSQFTRSILTLIADKLPMDVNTIGFALPAASGAMLVCLLFDFHLALGFSFTASLLLGVLFPGDPLMPLYYFVGSIVAALSVILCKKRTALLRAGALTGLVNMAAVAAIDLYRGVLLSQGMYDLSAGFLGGLVVSTIVSVSLPFFESVFDITTDIKLLELLEPNQPLLKELVYKSPGTYHHSIVIGNLAEAAAEAIGENPLLARVGAYYHDVGKIRKPEYFIENQRPSENKHDRLTPSMSSLIIASHVKDGVEVAREHKLPSTVVDIIQQHHGTSLITYFYQKAKDLQPLVKIAEGDYRYPGPKPRTKIAAIVMLSDSVEAASRTLEDPTPHRIQALTNSVITRIFLDDQLSNCDLTLKDLREISRSFNMVLTAIYHHRIDYPGLEFLGEKRRSEYRDKKQSEEAKSVPHGAREKAREVPAENRPT